jgi:hypothetical protein
MKHDTVNRSGAELSTPAGVVQLRLLPGGSALPDGVLTPDWVVTPDWILDERTRRVGRQGVAQAREILRRVAPPEAVRRAS